MQIAGRTEKVAPAQPPGAFECRAKGNHRAAQNDESEPTLMGLGADLQAMADQVKAQTLARRAATSLTIWPSLFVGPPAPIVVKTPTVAEYRAALAAHDWHFERSDDHGAWRAGRDSLQNIVRLQRLLDPGFRIWREYAPQVTA